MLDKDTDDGRYKKTKRCSSKAPQVFLQRQRIQALYGSMQKSIWKWIQKNAISKFNRRWESYFKSK